MKHAPPPFQLPNGNKAVFAKFLSATYELTFDCVNESVTVKTTIDLIVPESGQPVIDLSTKAPIEAIKSVKILSNASQLSALEEYQVPLTGQDAVGPDWTPLVSVLEEPLAAGATHTVEIQHTLKSHSKRNELLWDIANKSVYCFFEMSDETPGPEATYDGRHFLERYVPANFEYDQFPSVWTVKVTGAGEPHMLVTSVSAIPIELAAVNAFSATFTTPQWYSASSLFFFLGAKSKTQFAGPFSVDGVPITVFNHLPAAAPTLATWQPKITNKMGRLNADLGPFPCPHLIVYAGMGMAMEYANAIAASENNLLHELVHCYLGRSILPADGDSGWIDEGFAVWYEAAGMLPPQTNPPGPASKIGGIRPYRRGTDRRAWTQGRTMMAYLDHLLKNAGTGGLCDLVKLAYFGSAQGTIITTADLQAAVEKLTGVGLAAVFQRCIRS